MELKVYETQARSSFEYDFISEGPRGQILKRIKFSPMQQDDMFNVGLLDVDQFGRTSDLTISDNGDHLVVFATVARIILNFLKDFPNADLIIIGNHW